MINNEALVQSHVTVNFLLNLHDRLINLSNYNGNEKRFENS